MHRHNRLFTVEIRGRRKAAAFDWGSAFAAVGGNVADAPQVPRSESAETLPKKPEAADRSPQRRVLPSLPHVENPLPEVLPPSTRAKPVAAKVNTHPAHDASVFPEAVPVPTPADIIEAVASVRLRRSARVARAEKWKRRLPKILR